MIERRLLTKRIVLVFAITAISVALLLSSLSYTQTASAQTSGTKMLSCSPVSVPVAKDNSFSIQRGKQISFACVIRNMGSSELKVSLSARQTRKGDTNAPTISVSQSVGTDKSVVVPVQFPPVYAEGTYKFSFYLKNMADGRSVGNEVLLNGILPRQEAIIVSAGINKDSYVWREPITVNLSVSADGKTSAEEASLVFDVMVKNKNLENCAIVGKNIPVLSGNELAPMKAERDVYKLILPDQKGCEGALISVILKNKKGETLDTKNMPVSIPLAVSSSGSVNQKVVYVLVFLVVCAAGYSVLRRRQHAEAEIKTDTTPNMPSQ